MGILDSADIVAVAERLGIEVTDRFKSGSILARCPFHDDGQTPDLRLDPEKNTWHCFPCGRGGGLLDLIRERLGLETKAALAWLESRPADEPRRSRPRPASRPSSPSRSLERFPWPAAIDALEDTDREAWRRRGVNDFALDALRTGVVDVHFAGPRDARRLEVGESANSIRVFVWPMIGPKPAQIVGRRLRPVDLEAIGDRPWFRDEGEPKKAITWPEDSLGLLVPVTFDRQATAAVVTEGEADLFAALTLDFNAVGTAGTSLSDLALEALTNRLAKIGSIYLATQNDAPAEEWATRLRAALGSARCHDLRTPADCEDLCDALERDRVPAHLRRLAGSWRLAAISRRTEREDPTR